MLHSVLFIPPVPVVNGTDLGLMGGVKEALWIEVPHDTHRKHLTLESSDYAEVDTQILSSFYNSRKETLTPYATTILVPNRQDSCSVSIDSSDILLFRFGY